VEDEVEAIYPRSLVSPRLSLALVAGAHCRQHFRSIPASRKTDGEPNQLHC
jgi:hypothetical protein